MKKFIILLAAAVLFVGGNFLNGEENASETGGWSEPREAFIQTEEVRSTICTKCRGEGVCPHCDGECFRNGRRCRDCGGEGRCSACGGAGSLEVIEIDRKDYTVCTICHGLGLCGMCDGSGRYSMNLTTLGSFENDCMLCHGSGECLACHGAGLSELKGF